MSTQTQGLGQGTRSQMATTFTQGLKEAPRETTSNLMHQSVLDSTNLFNLSQDPLHHLR
jgi:hypothetical protein